MGYNPIKPARGIHFFSGEKQKKKGLTISCKALIKCGEYRSRTDDLLHAMQAL